MQRAGQGRQWHVVKSSVLGSEELGFVLLLLLLMWPWASAVHLQNSSFFPLVDGQTLRDWMNGQLWRHLVKRCTNGWCGQGEPCSEGAWAVPCVDSVNLNPPPSRGQLVSTPELPSGLKGREFHHGHSRALPREGHPGIQEACGAAGSGLLWAVHVLGPWCPVRLASASRSWVRLLCPGSGV